jgi:hypothetical protein
MGDVVAEDTLLSSTVFPCSLRSLLRLLVLIELSLLICWTHVCHVGDEYT